MAIHPSTQRSDRPATREAQVLERLVSARIFGPHAFFFVSGEGTFFPNGVEESSGFAIDRDGHVWSFWTGLGCRPGCRRTGRVGNGQPGAGVARRRRVPARPRSCWALCQALTPSGDHSTK